MPDGDDAGRLERPRLEPLSPDAWLEYPPPLADGAGVFGEWLGLARAIAKFAAQASGFPGGAFAAELAFTLLRIDDTQTRLLKSIKADTTLLRSEPFRTAKLNLMEATHIGTRDIEEWVRFVREAQRGFYSAHSLAADSQQRSIVEFNLYVVWMLLGREPDALRWLERSLASSEQAIDELMRPLRAYVRDGRPGKEGGSGARPYRAFVSRFIPCEWMDTTPVEASFSVLDANADLGIFTSDKMRSRAVLAQLIGLDEYIKFHNLVQHASAAKRASRNPIYLELFDTARRHLFKKEINHLASMKMDSMKREENYFEARKYLTLRPTEH